MIPMYVGGVGFWSPGFRDAAAWVSGVADPAVRTAPAEILPPALRRRATGLTLLAAEVAGQAARAAGADVARAPLILGSAYGEIGTAVDMMRSFGEGEGMPSPTRFHNSVHNTPAAYVSIATGNRGFSTALAAGPETTAAALFEAAALLAECGGEALLVLLDEPIPPPFTPTRDYPLAAAAIHVSVALGAAPLARLAGVRSGPAHAPHLGGGLAAHPCAGAFALVAALSRRASGPVPIGPFQGEGWIAELEAVGRP
jgi:hypothetical protein